MLPSRESVMCVFVCICLLEYAKRLQFSQQTRDHTPKPVFAGWYEEHAIYQRRSFNRYGAYRTAQFT